jgi:hypothetical protein
MITNPARNNEIEGYASKTSVAQGDEIDFYVNTSAVSYKVEIFRMGWYGGLGARKMVAAFFRTGVKQPVPAPDPATGLIECHWTDPMRLYLPLSTDSSTAAKDRRSAGESSIIDAGYVPWQSGIYLVKLTTGPWQRRAYDGKQAFIIFVVRDDQARSDILFQSSVTTFQAYNVWGGRSLYSNPRAYKVSFDRPYAHGFGTADFVVWEWEFNMLRFLEKNGYDVTYSTDIDTHENGGALLNHKAFLVIGHDEYWSMDMRWNVERARDHGVNLGFFGSNIAYWQVRFEPSWDGTRDRVMTCYKQPSIDPYFLDSDPTYDFLVTTEFRLSPVNYPEDALIGVMYENANVNSDIVISNADHWVFSQTGAKNGDHLPDLMGYESDRVFGHAPSNLQVLAHSPFPFGKETHYADMTIYQAPSGAYVFATGSMNWNWGLDDYNTNHKVVVSRAAQQITANVLSRFGAQPGPSVPEATFSRDTLNFVSPPGVASYYRSVGLTNTGTGSMSVQGFAVDGPFELINNCPATLEPAASCSIAARFLGTAKDAVGTLALQANTPDPHVVTLKGTSNSLTITRDPRPTRH